MINLLKIGVEANSNPLKNWSGSCHTFNIGSVGPGLIQWLFTVCLSTLDSMFGKSLFVFTANICWLNTGFTFVS